MTNLEFCRSRRKAELPAFVRVLKALPQGRLDYRPDPKARTAAELASVLVGRGSGPREPSSTPARIAVERRSRRRAASKRSWPRSSATRPRSTSGSAGSTTPAGRRRAAS